MKEEISTIKKFWEFLQEDSWPSFAVTLILAFILIKFVFFPGLSALTGTALPLVIVESCSMHHYEYGFQKIFESPIYAEHNISITDTEHWPFQDGFSKGDVIFVVGAKNIQKGDVIIFNGGARYPLIHRVIKNDTIYATKGDNYQTNNAQLMVEQAISKDQLVGKALFRIPAIGWIKLIFFEPARNPNERGWCR